MGVRKFRSVEEMPGPPPRRPLDPENLRLACELSDAVLGLARFHAAPGVRRFRSWEELRAVRERAAPTPVKT